MYVFISLKNLQEEKCSPNEFNASNPRMPPYYVAIVGQCAHGSIHCVKMSFHKFTLYLISNLHISAEKGLS